MAERKSVYDDYNPDQAFNGEGEDVVYGTPDNGDYATAQTEPAQSGGGDSGGSRMTEQDFQARLGDLYTPGAYEEYQHRDYDPGWAERIIAKEQLRADNEPGSTYHENGMGGYLTPPAKPAAAKGTSGLTAAFRGSTQSVGSDALSQLVSQRLQDLLSGNRSALGTKLQDSIMGIIGGPSQQEQAIRFEAARAPIEKFRRAQTNQARAQLANRGLLSEPGIPQGTEAGTMGRIEEMLAPAYAQAGQEAYLGGLDRQLAGISLGNQIDTGERTGLLDAINSATGRQTALSNIALQTLDRNIAWNQFLANLGLDRDQIMYQLQNGQLNALNPLLQMFMQGANTSAGGHY